VKKREKARYIHNIYNRKYSLSPLNDHSNHKLFLNPNLIGNFYFSDYDLMQLSLKMCCSYDKGVKCF